MYKLLFLNKTILSAGACGVFLCYSLPQASTLTKTPDAVSVERLRRLGNTIDSLEVEKQVKKRIGLPLAELEAKTANLRDSIKTIRLEIGQGTAAEPETKDSFQEYLKKMLSGSKSTLYDRMLLAAGAIATVIGLFFLSLRLALKSRRKKQTQLQIKRVASQHEDVQRKVTAAQNAYPDSFATTTSESAALASAIPASAPAVPAPAAQHRPPAQNSGGDLKALILKASNEGLNAKEISRRYHVGIDQVALMLKMAKKR